MTGHYAATIPDHPALSFEGRVTNWRSLDDWVKAVESRLRALAEPGDRVAFLGKNSDWNVVVAIAAARTGVVLLGLNWRLSPSELLRIVGDAAPKVIVVDTVFRETAVSALMPAVSQIIWLSIGFSGDGFISLERQGKTYPEAKPLGPTDATLWQLYTSGTTGTPKGALLSRRAVEAAFSIWNASGWTWTDYEGSNCLVWLPMFHLGGILMATNVLRQGGHAIIVESYSIDGLIDLINEHQLAVINGVPTMIHDFVTAVERRGITMPSLQYIVYGAAPVSPELLRRAMAVLNCKFTQSYGSTETGGMISWLVPEDHKPHLARLNSAGLPLPGVEIAIVDGEWAELACTEIGEVVVRSDAVMEGYWGRSEETAITMRDGWVRTGDLGYKDAEGYLYLVDRVADMIVSGAENIYPKEVEDAISEDPNVAEVAVFGVEDERWGLAVACAVVPRGDGFSAENLRLFAGDRLASYKIPRHVFIVNALPRSPAGKVQRRAVRDMVLSSKIPPT